MGNPKDDEMKLSDEKPVEEVIKEAYSEIETRDARIRELEEENARLKAGQNSDLGNAPKIVREKMSSKKTIAIIGFVVTMMLVIEFIVIIPAVNRYYDRKERRDHDASEAAKLPALGPDEILAYTDCEVLDNWDEKHVLLVRKYGEEEYIHIDRMLYEIMDNSCGRWNLAFQSYFLNDSVDKRGKDEKWINRKHPKLSPAETSR